MHSGVPIAADDSVRRDVDHAYRKVIFFGRNDVLAVRTEERVIWDQEGLTRCKVTRTRELPHQAPLRVYDYEPVVPLVGNQEIGG
jgi:hypothetical protein